MSNRRWVGPRLTLTAFCAIVWAMRAQLIYNPVAGPRDAADDMARVLTYLERQGWEITLRQTFGPGDATTYAHDAAAAGYDMVIAAGGDGTIGEVASGLAHSDCRLGVLPVGTGNVWAHTVGIPVWTPMHRDALLEAAQILIEGRDHRIDLGRVGGRYFVLWAGIGFDAQVTHDIEPHREVRRALGQLSYYVTAVVLAFSLRGTRVSLDIDGETYRHRALMILVTNVPLYGQSFYLAPQAQLDDGWLDLYVFKGGNTLDAFRQFGLLLLGKHLGDPSIETYRVRRVEVHSEKPLPLHLDGDPAGYSPLTIEVAPKALRVVVPPAASLALSGGGSLPVGEPSSLAGRIAAYLRQERRRLFEEGERIREYWERRLGLSRE
ncbi:MAG: diacylglycerol kinase family lipid kinase [Chloroflexi bacterium]|nr:diacylglycerol kinase family lipid kinase [Chloroflexota bacterium]